MVLALLGDHGAFNSRRVDGVDMVGSTLAVSEWGGEGRGQSECGKWIRLHSMEKRVFPLGRYDFNLTRSNLISFGSGRFFLRSIFSCLFLFWVYDLAFGKREKRSGSLLQRRESLHSNDSRGNERCDVGISCIGIGEMILPDGVDWSGVLGVWKEQRYSRFSTMNGSGCSRRRVEASRYQR